MTGSSGDGGRHRGMPRRTVRARPLTPADTRAIATWRYAGRDAAYDPDDEVSPELGFVGLVDEGGELVGHAVTGPEARVPGLPPEPGVVDVGVGLRPDLVGGGWGPGVTAAVVAHARDQDRGARHVRAVVLEWNERSRRTLRGAGFTETCQHVTADGRVFVVAVRPLR